MKAELVLETRNSRHQFGLPFPCRLLLLEKGKFTGIFRITVEVNIDDLEIETFVNLEHFLAGHGIRIISISYEDAEEQI